MLKIICVCGMGLGSSVIAKMNVEEILSKMGVDALIDTCDLGSVTSVQADYYITTKELADNIPESLQNQTIILTNFVNQEEIKKTLKENLERRS